MLSKEMLRTQSFLLRCWREKQRSAGADRVGLTLVLYSFSDGGSDAAFHWCRASINVTLKKRVDWVELKENRSQVSLYPPTGAGTGV
jgi:hypothetical protein